MRYLEHLGGTPVVLCSASRRRSDILTQLGIRHEVFPPDVDEHTTLRSPRAVVLHLARKKAAWSLEAYAQKHGAERMHLTPTLFIAADTIVRAPWGTLGHMKNKYTDTLIASAARAFGKPRSADEARRMLRILSGKTHTVYSGVCVLLASADGRTRCCCACETARVSFHRLSEADIDAYLATNEWHDVAGAYAIQGASASFIRRIRGSHFTVMGLPTAPVLHAISRMEIPQKGRT